MTTRSGEEYTGIIKDVTESAVVLMGADAKAVRIPKTDIESQQTSEISLMPEGLTTSLSREEFTDLIEYLVSLKQPANTQLTELGMPDVIPALSPAVELAPVFPWSGVSSTRSGSARSSG